VSRVVAPCDPAALHERARAGFERRFGGAADLVVYAPGRANQIGEHTDYNDGFVLPFALARRTAVAVRRRADRSVHAASGGASGGLVIDLDAEIRPEGSGWGNYVRGVVALCRESGRDPGGFDAWIDSDVPVGAGLSSSAALEVAFAGVCERLSGKPFDPVEKASLCRRAEHEFAGVPCGIMDQMASVLASEDSLLFLDCRDNSWRRVPLGRNAAEIVVVDSELPHDLGEGAFARRVAECRAAAEKIGVASLREASVRDVEKLASAGETLLHARALHVVEENARVLAAVEAVESRSWSRLGGLLDAGHTSLRDLYEVSRPEMDALVERLKELGALGARMTGGGFGGCAVAIFPAGTGAATMLKRRLG
jgi:galactokinase